MKEIQMRMWYQFGEPEIFTSRQLNIYLNQYLDGWEIFNTRRHFF